MATHWKQLINLDYIGAYSLGGNDLVVKIQSVAKEMVTGDKGKKEMCMVARLENQKPFIINRTNAKMITKLCNSPYIEDWVGKSITLYVSTTSVAGETVECLRVRPTLPTVGGRAKIELTPESDKWADAVKFIAEGGTVEKLLTRYMISEDNQMLLKGGEI